MSNLNKPAPLFTAPAIVNSKIVQNFSLQNVLSEKSVLLFFYPKDFTFICPTELLMLQKNIHLFHEQGIEVIAISTDTVETHQAWLKTPISKGGIEGVTFPLVADESKTISINYQVLAGSWHKKEEGLHFEGAPIAYRASFLIDKERKIHYQSVHHENLGRDINELLRIVDMWNATKNSSFVCPANWQKKEPMLDPTVSGIQNYLTKNYTEIENNPYAQALEASSYSSKGCKKKCDC